MHQLDRDRSLQHHVESSVDGRHTAPPDLLVEAIAPAQQGSERGHPAAIVRRTQAAKNKQREQQPVDAVGQQRAAVAMLGRSSGALTRVETKALPAPVASVRPAPSGAPDVSSSDPLSALAPRITGSAACQESACASGVCEPARSRRREGCSVAGDPGMRASACASPSASPSPAPASFHPAALSPCEAGPQAPSPRRLRSGRRRSTAVRRAGARYRAETPTRRAREAPVGERSPSLGVG